MPPPIFTTLTPPQTATIATMPLGGVWYSFTLTAPRRVRIDTASTSSPATRSHSIFLVDADGNSQSEPFTSRNGEGPGGTAAIDVELAAGTYYFVVVGADPFFGSVSAFEVSGDSGASAAGTNTQVRISARVVPPSFGSLEDFIAPGNWAAGSGRADITAANISTLAGAQAAVTATLAASWDGTKYDTAPGNAMLFIFPTPVDLSDMWFETNFTSLRVRLYNNAGATILEETEGRGDAGRLIITYSDEFETRVAQPVNLFAPLAPPVTGVKAILLMGDGPTTPWEAQVFSLATGAVSPNGTALGTTIFAEASLTRGLAFVPQAAPGALLSTSAAMIRGNAFSVGAPTPTRLEKTVLRTYQRGTPGVPAFAGQPALPARTVYETTTICGYRALNASQVEDVLRQAGIRFEQRQISTAPDGTPIFANVPIFPPGFTGTDVDTVQYSCRTEGRFVDYPAQPFLPPTPAIPAVPEQYLYDFQLGWNARARSITSMRGDGRYSFRVPVSTVGAVVGLTDNPQDSGYGDIRWGFSITRGVVRAVERGVEVQSFGTFPNASLSIERSAGEIVYRIAGVDVRRVPSDGGTMVLGAALYSGDDGVEDASFTELSSGRGYAALGPLAALALGPGVSYAQGAGALQPLRSAGSGRTLSTSQNILSGLSAYGADAVGYAVAVGALRGLVAEGEGGLGAPSFTAGIAALSPLTGVSYGFTGTVGSAEVVLGPLAVIGSQGAYAQASGAFTRGLTSYGENLQSRDEASMLNLLGAFEDAQGAPIMLAVINADMEVEGILLVQGIAPALMIEMLNATDTTALTQELQALLATVMSAQSVTGDPSRYTVWALNTVINGMTRYDNYAFNSLARVGQSYFGASRDGLYRLEGPDDDGVRIDSQINLGRMNFGTQQRKALPFVYVGIASDGRPVLKVEADGETFYYRLRDWSTELENQRFELGRGLRAAYYNLTIINEGGHAFELAEIEFTPVTLKRRL